ncbi:MAG: hypothetical protein ACM33B_09205 [Pseudomonadota bacterium]
MTDWDEQARRAEARYRDGEERVADEPDARQRQLTRLGNAAWAAGLSALMAGRVDDARAWLERASDRYRESYRDAPPDSWGRPVAILKALLVAGLPAADAARWTLGEGAAAASSPIGRYAATLAHAVLGEWEDVRVLADELRTHDGFPHDVADALAFLAAEDVVGYVVAVESVLASFERRDEFLEDVRVADTVLALQALAANRGIAAELDSPLLPAG